VARPPVFGTLRLAANATGLRGFLRPPCAAPVWCLNSSGGVSQVLRCVNMFVWCICVQGNVGDACSSLVLVDAVGTWFAG
jgi:hypothetical protein